MKIRFTFLFFSLSFLLLGFLCYFFLRESNLIINKFLDIKFNNIFFSYDNLFLKFLKYNLPDGLWILSGILLIRSIWINDFKISNIYVYIFIFLAILFEFFQLFNFIPGTFDFFDIFIMILFAFIEQVCYNGFIKRRLLK